MQSGTGTNIDVHSNRIKKTQIEVLITMGIWTLTKGKTPTMEKRQHLLGMLLRKLGIYLHYNGTGPKLFLFTKIRYKGI